MTCDAALASGATISVADQTIGSVSTPPSDWREAPLFAGSMTGGPDAELPQPSGLFVRRPDAEPAQSDGALAADPEPHAEWADTASDALAPQSGGLFVRRSDAGAVQ
ncbi:hypothetical protein [Paracoccus versutus]|uniref:hypothetical protein n=1 Tax=Paracoccus versutus TaxID=34007 RepID=UPI00215D7A38|nr:hypothetical protein [Paracoccus versutus]